MGLLRSGRWWPWLASLGLLGCADDVLGQWPDPEGTTGGASTGMPTVSGEPTLPPPSMTTRDGTVTTDDTSHGTTGSEGTSSDGTGSGSTGDSGSTTGTLPDEGFGDCANNPPGAVCLPQENCLVDGGLMFGVCSDVNCVTPLDCPVAPPGGTAPVLCTDFTGGGGPECILSCAMGETCPPGMTCYAGQLCAWPEI